MTDSSDTAPSAAPPVDDFAVQKNNIRDTAKWMATAYAAIAAVMIAGAPFSGLGTLPGCRLVIAVVAGLASIACSLLAIHVILRLLIGDYCFAGSLDHGAKTFVDKHARDVLPIPFKTTDELLLHRETIRKSAIELWSEIWPPPSRTTPEYEEAARRYEQLRQSAEQIEGGVASVVSLAHLYLLRQKLKSVGKYLAVLTATAVLGLIVAVGAATPEKRGKSVLMISSAVANS